MTNDLDKSDSAGASRKSLRMDSTEVHSASDEDKENESAHKFTKRIIN